MSVLVVGISHKTAPVSVLERVALDAEGAHEAGPRGLRPRARHRGHGALDLQPHRGLRRRRPVPRQRRGDLADARRAAPASRPRTCSSHLYVHYDDGAVSHLFHVAAGLDSMVLGESQILGQTREALRVGQEPAPSAPPSTCCSSRRCASASARTPRPTSTGSPRAWSPTALDRAAEHVGDLAGKHVVVVGAGSMAGLTVGHRRRAPAPRSIVVANRTPERAARLAAAVRRAGDPARRARRASPARSTCSSPAPARPAS